MQNCHLSRQYCRAACPQAAGYSQNAIAQTGNHTLGRTPNGVVMLIHHRRLEGKPPYRKCIIYQISNMQELPAFLPGVPAFHFSSMG